METSKFTISLSDEQRGPFPVATESIWFDKVSPGWRIKNIPFFVDGVAFDDIVKLSMLETGEYIIDLVLEESGNSTIWVYINNKVGENCLQELKNIGCGVEGGVFEGYYAVNVPALLNWSTIENALGLFIDNEDISVDYPCVRAKHNGESAP